MVSHNLYNCYSTPTGHRIVKFDADLNVEAVYNLTPIVGPLSGGRGWLCDCPAGPRPTCKHRKMLPIFTAANAINTDRFYCYETQMWHRPIATADEPPMQEKLDLFNEALSGSASCDCRSMDECNERAGCQVKGQDGFAVERPEFETFTAIPPQPCKPREAAQQIVAEQMKPIRRI